MSAPDDRDFQQWTKDWQAGTPRDVTSEEQIRGYVKRRSKLLWSFVVADFVIVGIAVPVLIYLAIASRSDVERLAMLGLLSITIATVGFSWWNWHGVLGASAASTAEYLVISAERLRRMRLAWRVAWVVLTAELLIFIVWIWDLLYSGARPHDASAERFAWGWLIGFSIAFIAGLVWYGRWITRDAARFEALRRELDA